MLSESRLADRRNLPEGSILKVAWICGRPQGSAPASLVGRLFDRSQKTAIESVARDWIRKGIFPLGMLLLLRP